MKHQDLKHQQMVLALHQRTRDCGLDKSFKICHRTNYMMRRIASAISAVTLNASSTSCCLKEQYFGQDAIIDLHPRPLSALCNNPTCIRSDLEQLLVGACPNTNEYWRDIQVNFTIPISKAVERSYIDHTNPSSAGRPVLKLRRS